ncbi:isopenicillin N synthase family oxygenase [Blastococcus sp. TF02A-26]|uniref:isopenicillin N synthase family dioxygenase n=1 Tax=Blastococcus sp. TF02A-26 TaxID=2250577 RepID=UPI000DEB3B88|nr:2OG-Fe(II) oxygenase family protein [Blastococcus sp. TF02A-26]RBY83337.1 isopenicillin N synthase family oxygenase [Blastococcus sp. TF02A-26]
MTSHLTELDREARMGARGTVTSAREVRRISLADLPGRRAEIADELWAAATDIGFFQVVDHGIPQAQIDGAFAAAEAFFALPEEVKARRPLVKALNAGWESKSQVRPSIGTPDEKESFQLTRPHMAGRWPTDEELAGFRDTMLAFEARCWQVAMDVLSCFALRLGFAEDFFARAHDPAAPGYRSALRLLHYFAVAPEVAARTDLWRAGAHTDFDCLTLLFQRAGQGGLQVLPGAEADGEAWTPIEPSDDAITCNIGDMLTRWSDDVLPSNFHRVTAPGPGDDLGPRYSIAFFAQANDDVVIESAAYPPITAGDFLVERIRANYGR